MTDDELKVAMEQIFATFSDVATQKAKLQVTIDLLRTVGFTVGALRALGKTHKDPHIQALHDDLRAAYAAYRQEVFPVDPAELDDFLTYGDAK